MTTSASLVMKEAPSRLELNSVSNVSHASMRLVSIIVFLIS